jgi:hypothetical protein
MLPPCPPCRVYNSPRSPEIKNGNNSASKRQKLGPTLFGTPSPPMTILFPTFLVESLVRPNSRRARHWKSWTKFLPLRVNYFSVFRNPEKYVFVVHSVRWARKNGLFFYSKETGTSNKRELLTKTKKACKIAHQLTQPFW